VKSHMSKRAQRERRENLKTFGEDGSFKTEWKRLGGNRPDGTWKTCPWCGDASFISHQDLPGVCSRETCRYRFVEARRGKRS
jgi:hypothetical protein